MATYHRFVPSFRAVLRENGGDLEKFYKHVEALGKLPKKERHSRLLERAQTTENEPESTVRRKLAMTRDTVSTKP